jgi:excinuclease ABC subunit A
MTIDEALIFFNDLTNKYESKIIQRIAPLQDVGLGYIQLGQASSTLSGGEAQRIKLASFLGINSKRSSNTLFIFDEPTTGLHFYDIEKLLKAINSLIESGNHVIIIEHNPEIIKSADWIIDLGPEGGDKGGNIVFEGLVEDIIEHETSYTGKYLKKHVKGIYKKT